MSRKFIPAAVGSVLLAGTASAFDGWCVCPPPRAIYYPPVIYHAPPAHAAVVSWPPGVPMNLPKPGELPRPMSSAPTVTEERSKEVAPAEFRSAPKAPAESAPAPKTGSPLAIPSAAPPRLPDLVVHKGIWPER